MDAKITLSFDENVIKKAKKYQIGTISAFRLVESFGKITQAVPFPEDYPMPKWVNR